jgi:hypothetical protein
MNVLILAAMLAAAAPGYGAPQLADHGVSQFAHEVDCASEDMQVLYYYLAPDPDKDIKERATLCHGAQVRLKMPEWLETELPAMREKKVWTDPEEGKLSEAELWQTSFSILYELAATTHKTLPPADGGPGVAPALLEAQYNDMRLRFILSLDRIARSGLEGSFGGRGTALLTAMNSVVERLDGITAAIAKKDDAAFNKSAAGAIALSRDVFAQFFKAPNSALAGKFKPAYTPEARVLPGYRGVSLKVSGSQVMFLESGDRADMLVTFEAVMNSGTKEKVTATILQNVVVVKVHRPDTAAGTGVVQLLCNPNEAQYAALSLGQGSAITLVRRAPGDTEMRPMEIASLRKLFK